MRSSTPTSSRSPARSRQHNGFTNIEFVQANSREFTPPEPIDVVLHEQMGDELFNENMLQNVLDLRDRVLRPGGRILPATFRLFVEPVTMHESMRVRRFWNIDLPDDIDLSGTRGSLTAVAIRHRPQRATLGPPGFGRIDARRRRRRSSSSISTRSTPSTRSPPITSSSAPQPPTSSSTAAASGSRRASTTPRRCPPRRSRRSRAGGTACSASTARSARETNCAFASAWANSSTRRPGTSTSSDRSTQGASLPIVMTVLPIVCPASIARMASGVSASVARWLDRLARRRRRRASRRAGRCRYGSRC